MKWEYMYNRIDEKLYIFNIISKYNYEQLYITNFSIKEYDKHKELLNSSDNTIRNMILEILKNKCIKNEKQKR